MKNRRIKLILADLDGTLLDDQKQITSRTREALFKSAQQGVQFIPATGRPISGVPKEVLELPGVRYVLTANGARIVDLKEDKIIHEELLSYERGKKILEIMSDYDCFMEIYFDGIGYAKEDLIPHLQNYLKLSSMRDYIRNTRKRIPDIMEYYEDRHSDTDKVQAFFRSQHDKCEARERIEKAVDQIEITGALDCNIEIGAKGVNKGQGLISLAQLIGVPVEETIAFGDGGNDASMIQAAGIGVAMANGCKEAKEVADVIALSNEEDGLARVIETYVLNN